MQPQARNVSNTLIHISKHLIFRIFHFVIIVTVNLGIVIIIVQRMILSNHIKVNIWEEVAIS